ncbi:MAG: DUF697 domain-containing protein [Bacteroidota bacterium]
MEGASELQISHLNNQRVAAEKIIRRYALFSTASGLIPFTGVDVLAATALQTQMVREIADVYDYDIDEQLLRTAITTGATAIAGRLLTEIINMLAESFSPLKGLVNSATQAAVTGFLTLEIGTLYQLKMERGENPSDIGVMDIVSHLVDQVQEGKWDPDKLSLTGQLGTFLQLAKG